MKILVCFKIPDQSIEHLKNDFELIIPQSNLFTKEEILDKIKDCEGMISFFSSPIDKEIIEAGKNLKIISNYGVGYNNIDIKTATKNNIVVCNTPNSVCMPTAELTIGLIIDLLRGISDCNKSIKNNNEEWGLMKNLGFGLQNKTLGIIGLGKIGKTVAKICNTLGMNIIYHNRNRLNPIEESQLQIKYSSFNFLIENSDIISLHCPLTPSTKHIISETELKKMKKSAYLINTARGAVVNENDLIKALKHNLIAGAALDVFEYEPSISKELRNTNNTILVPHIGTATIETRINMGIEASSNIYSYLIEGKEINKVN